MNWFAFTSGDGRVAGVARGAGLSTLLYGVAMAVLEAPCGLFEWQRILTEEPTPEAAVNRLLAEKGGARIEKVVPIVQPGWLLQGTTPAEA